MSRNWAIFEKIFAVIQITIAGFMVYGLYEYLKADENYEAGEDEFFEGKSHTTFHFYLSRNQQIYLLIAVCLCGSLLWLFNKKLGWVLSLSFFSSYLGFTLMYSLFWLPIEGYSQWLRFILEVLTTFIFIAFLVQKPLVEKYRITKKDWAITAVMVILISLDLNWHRLF